MKATNILLTKLIPALGCLCLLLSASVVLAQDEDAEDPAESTIRLMDIAEADLPGVVTREISLPPAAVENAKAVENAERGLMNAQENRDRGPEHGLTQAEQAREKGAEMAEEARRNQENRGRSEDRPTPPNRPEPGPPQPPGGPPGN